MVYKTKIHKFIEFIGDYAELKHLGFQWLGPPHNDSMIWEKNDVFIYKAGNRVRFNQMVRCGGQLLSLIEDYRREGKQFPIEDGLLVCYVNDDILELSFNRVGIDWKRRYLSMDSLLVLVDLLNRGYIEWVEMEAEYR